MNRYDVDVMDIKFEINPEVISLSLGKILEV